MWGPILFGGPEFPPCLATGEPSPTCSTPLALRSAMAGLPTARLIGCRDSRKRFADTWPARSRDRATEERRGQGRRQRHTTLARLRKRPRTRDRALLSGRRQGDDQRKRVAQRLDNDTRHMGATDAGKATRASGAKRKRAKTRAWARWRRESAREGEQRQDERGCKGKAEG